jgi:hypothetical protein
MMVVEKCRALKILLPLTTPDDLMMSHHEDRNGKPIPFLTGVLDRHHHVCAFVETSEEVHRLFGPFLVDGLEQGEKALLIVTPANRESSISYYQNIGLDVVALENRGQLEILTWYEGHLRSGQVDPPAMLQLIGDVLSNARENGFPRTRLVADMHWVKPDEADVRELLAFEAHADGVLSGYRDPVVCVYPATFVDNELTFDLLRTHALVVVGGQLKVSAYYEPPDGYMEQLVQTKHKRQRQEEA